MTENAYVKFHKCRLPFPEFKWVSFINEKFKTFNIQETFIRFEFSQIECYKKKPVYILERN